MQGALSRVDGVKSAEVSLEDQRATVKHTLRITPADLIKAVEETGFKAKEEKPEGDKTERAN